MNTEKLDSFKIECNTFTYYGDDFTDLIVEKLENGQISVDLSACHDNCCHGILMTPEGKQALIDFLQEK